MLSFHAVGFAATGGLLVQLLPSLLLQTQVRTLGASWGWSTTTPTDLDIVDMVTSKGNFQVLVEALRKAKLVETLSGDGPFTLFAPTDAAFAALLGTLDVTKEELLAFPNLADILKYHIISGSKILRQGSMATRQVETLQGDTLTLTTLLRNAGSANVETVDIGCTNGVVHIIDAVLLPPPKASTTTKTDEVQPTTTTRTEEKSILPSTTGEAVDASLEPTTSTRTDANSNVLSTAGEEVKTSSEPSTSTGTGEQPNLPSTAGEAVKVSLAVMVIQVILLTSI
eukprot:TRINITY_DN7249_c0_g1_i2.p1 TRINITY_DN7249_c0_g1~~TRINITY_DN7249_c0_g1_i2.p1  ORF type:complete len:283 (-),score=66.64 TRINITY_DN7249_c0_g1_i2:11-859(-)